MAKPIIHAVSSARKWGGEPEDYLEIHNLMDSSKAAMADNRHRALTHNAWFIGHILEKIFGVTITNSNGRKVSVRDIGEQHVLEDYGKKFIPTAQDFLQEMEMKPWMQNGHGTPDSSKRLKKGILDGNKRSDSSDQMEDGQSQKGDVGTGLESFC